MKTYCMSYETENAKGRGCINEHLSPMTISEMNHTLSYYKRQGFRILNLKIWPA